jgi:hypothetical protein
MTLKAANPVLQTTPGTLECIVDRKINVGVALVGIRLVPNIDFLFVRQSEPWTSKRPPVRRCWPGPFNVRALPARVPLGPHPETPTLPPRREG